MTKPVTSDFVTGSECKQSHEDRADEADGPHEGMCDPEALVMGARVPPQVPELHEEENEPHLPPRALNPP